MNLGVPPTARKARTGEFTPPGITSLARARRAADAGASGAVWTGTGCELMPPVSQPRRDTRRAGWSAVADVVRVQVVAHDGHGPAERRELLGRHDVDHVVAHALDVHPGDVPHGGEATGGEYELDPSPVVGALLARHPPAVLESLGGVGQAAARLDDHRGELRHAQPVVLPLGQHRDDLVLAQLKAGIAERVVEGALEQPRAAQDGSPRRLLGVAEPAHALIPCT